jgi:hypothetical protein
MESCEKLEADVEKLMKELKGIRLQITQPLDYATRKEQLKQWSKIWNPDLPATTKGGAPDCPDQYKTFLKQLKRDLSLEKDYLSESKQTRRNKFSPKMVSRNRVWNKSIWDDLMAPYKPEVKPTKRHDEDESNKRMDQSNPYVEPTKRHDEDESNTLFDQDNHDDKDTKNDDKHKWVQGYFHGEGPVPGIDEVTVYEYKNEDEDQKKDEVHEEFSEKQPVSTPTVFSRAVNTIKTQAKSLFGRGGKQKRKKTRRKRRK